MIYQLMYYSIAEDAFAKGQQGRPGATEAAIDDIVRTALVANPAHEITGFLTFNGVEFLQFIEGPEAAVSQLMENISNDDRHHSVLIIETAVSDKRAFPEWSMRRLTDGQQRGGSASIEQAAPDLRSSLAALVPEFRSAYVNYLAGT